MWKSEFCSPVAVGDAGTFRCCNDPWNFKQSYKMGFLEAKFGPNAVSGVPCKILGDWSCLYMLVAWWKVVCFGLLCPVEAGLLLAAAHYWVRSFEEARWTDLGSGDRTYNYL